MIPVLYDNAERAFVTNGIGRLSDCISCTVTEERNGIYELEFEYPITGVRYNDIQEGCIVTATHDDTGDIQPFDIYGRTAPINGIVTFYAHHVSYRLSDIVVGPCTASSPADALDKIRRNSINGNPFTFWTNKTGSGEFKVETPDYARALLGGQQGSILDVYGKGDYEFDRWTVKLYLNRGTDSGVEIRYGKNLSDIKHDIDISESYNAVVPYWTSSDGDLVMLPEKILIYSGATDRDANLTDEDWQIIRDENGEPIEVTYQIIDAKPLDLSSEFQEAPTVEQLRSLAQTKLTESEGWVPDENITVDFVQLWQTEEYKDYAPLQRVRLCDTVSVYYPELGVEAVEAKVIKTVYNVLLDRYDSIELGTPQTTLAQAINKGMAEKIEELPTVDMMEEAITKATDLISGGLGGYVYLKPNANGEPEEILIMDSPDINQAVHVIRMNQNGIGFSSTGYSGPFRSAWTIDGSFVADFITAGTMSANRIKGGTLTLGGGSNGNGVLEVYNGSNSLVGRMNNAGLYAIAGTIGGWTIGTASLYNGMTSLDDTSHNGVWIGTDGIALGKGVFKVTNTGALTATNASLRGSLTSTDSYNRTVSLTTAQLQFTGYSSGEDVNWFSIYTTVGGAVRETARNDISYNGTRFFWGILQSAGSSTSTSAMSIENGVSDGYMCHLYSKTHIANLTVSGTKNRVVETDDYGNRLLYCYEMPSPMFGDIGEGVIGEDGLCYVWIESIFSRSITTDNYQVFLQRYGDGECYVSERTPSYFVVTGTAGMAFGWELKAKQADFDQLRLEAERNDSIITTDYGAEFETYYTDLKEGRLSA